MYKKYRMETPNPKCPRCKCYWKPTETDIKTSGLPYRTCLKCRENAKAYRDRLNIIPLTDEGLMNTKQAIYSRQQYYKNIEYFREKIGCACGYCICRDNLRKHIKSSKHQQGVSNT